jgi:GNAT superfamily N-acetyltransferase
MSPYDMSSAPNPDRIPFSDIALSRRLERAEGMACVRFAEARRHLFADSEAAWMFAGGACAIFDGIDSPITQTFGLGLFEELGVPALQAIETFFQERGAPVFHEMSPLAGVAALDMLCARNYRPVEISCVLYREVQQPADDGDTNVRVRAVGPDEAKLWTDISVRGWGDEHPELRGFLQEVGPIFAARAESFCLLAEVDGKPGAAGVLALHDGVALFGGAATVPELRRRGLQAALLQERMRFAVAHGCDLAMMVAQAGSESQRNAERKGFRIAYTRTKWRLQG